MLIINNKYKLFNNKYKINKIQILTQKKLTYIFKTKVSVTVHYQKRPTQFFFI